MVLVVLIVVMMTIIWIFQLVWTLSAWSKCDFSLSLCVELQLPVLSFTIHRYWSGSLLLASHSSPPYLRCRSLCAAPLVSPNMLSHTLFRMLTLVLMPILVCLVFPLMPLSRNALFNESRDL